MNMYVANRSLDVNNAVAGEGTIGWLNNRARTAWLHHVRGH